MQANKIVSMLYGAIGHQSITLAASPDAILDFISLAISNVWAYEWKPWSFKFKYDEVFTTTGTSNTFSYTINDADKYGIERVNSITAYDSNWNELSIGSFDKRNDWVVSAANHIFYEVFGNVIKVYDVPWSPRTYRISYVRSFKNLTSTADVIPLPDIFIPALYMLVISYIQLPFLQTDVQQNMYQIAKDMLADLAKLDWIQITQVSTKIK